MNTRAEYVRDDVFLAIHTNRTLRMRQRDQPNMRTQDLRTWTESPEDFLLQFLKPDAQARVAVLGESGSGKSHLIHWMKLRIPSVPSVIERHVLTIGKSRINLRSVLEMIIGLLPVARRANYTAKLEDAGQHAYDTVQRRERLLAEIGLAVGRDIPRSEDPRERELEDILIQELPSLFTDPDLRRNFWQGDDTLIARLVGHIEGGNPFYERRTDVQQFAAADLPFTDRVIRSSLAETTRDLLRDLSSDRAELELALKIVNRNLRDALSGVLNFTGDQLITLMEEVRGALYLEGKELVLLIEDFARLQGVDRALLQALTVESGPIDNKLCTLRWAMAMTGGYYAELDPTAKTRMTSVVEMDQAPEFVGEAFGQPTLTRFAVPYLNASRIPSDQLESWYEAGAKADDLPNACEPCQYRAECHSAFGSTAGIGHYPFTQNALWEMGHRANPHMGEVFNPRSLIDEVLVDVLNLRADDLRDGRFPPPSLLERLGGTALDADIRLRLERNDRENAPRQEAALNLWGRPPRASELPLALYQAFDLAPPRLDPELVNSGVTEWQNSDSNNSSIRPASDAQLTAVEEWGRGNLLPYGQVGALRDLVYESVQSHLDWDAAGFERAHFAQKSGYSIPFKAANIFLRNQETPPLPNAQTVVLSIPVRDDPAELRDASIAVRGLVLFKRGGSWDFEGGHLALTTLADQLDTWSAELVKLLRAWSTRDESWNPVGAAVEVLAIGAAMAGRLSESQDMAEALSALFDPWPETTGGQTKAWKELYGDIYARKEDLEKVVRSRASSMKGGQVGPFLDVVLVLPALRQIRGSWVLNATPPAGMDQGKSSIAVTARLHARIRATIAAVAREEYAGRSQWLGMVRAHVASGTRRADLVADLRKTMDSVLNSGISVSSSVRSNLSNALANFETTQFDAVVRAAEDLTRTENPLRALPGLGRTQPAAVDVTTALISAADRFVVEALQGVALIRADLQAKAGTDLAGDKTRIESALGRLEKALAEIGKTE